MVERYGKSLSSSTNNIRSPGQKTKNRMMRQNKCGEAWSHMAQQSLKHNTEYVEIDPKGTLQQCCMCYSTNTWRKGSRFRCHNCDVLMDADINAAFNILYACNTVQWSKHAQDVYSLQAKAGMVLRGKIHLGTCTPPPSVNDVMTGTGHPKDRHQNLTNKERLLGAPLNGNSPTSVVTQAVNLR